MTHCKDHKEVPWEQSPITNIQMCITQPAYVRLNHSLFPDQDGAIVSSWKFGFTDIPDLGEGLLWQLKHFWSMASTS